MAIEILAEPPKDAVGLVAAMFTREGRGWIEPMRKARAYLDGLEKEILKHDENSTEQVA